MMKKYIFHLATPLLVGALSAFFTRNSMEIYQDIVKPPLSPPSFIFPIVWLILYTLMGVSSYIIANSSSTLKNTALFTYRVSLAVNFSWPFLFFNEREFLFSFLIIIALWLLILKTIYDYYKIDKLAALLQIPYLLWVTFAAYLNYSIYLLN